MESEIIMAAENVKSGISRKTPENLLFGAGTIHKNLTYGEHYALTEDTIKDSSKKYYEMITPGSAGGTIEWKETTDTAFESTKSYYEKFEGFSLKNTLLGATNGGVKVSIKPEFTDVPVDGALVKVKRLTVKTGETAVMETTLTEITEDTTAMALNGEKGNSKFFDIKDTHFAVRAKPSISEGDYINNLAYVGHRIDDGSNRKVIVIFKNALCTSGYEIEGKNKETAGLKLTFECYADLTNNPSTLPYEIIYLS